MSKLKVNEIEPFSNVGIGIGGPSNESSALVNLQSSNQGILIPRLTTTERNAIASPKQGLLIYNKTAGRTEEYNGTTWVAAGNSPQKFPNVLRVKKSGDPMPGDFTTVKAAVDSITDNGPDNGYYIAVGPGVFIEDTITLKQFVFIEGYGDQITIIQASDPKNSVFIGAPNSGIKNIMVTGSIDSGAIAIIHRGDAENIFPFKIDSVVFGSNDTHVKAVSDPGVPLTIVEVLNCRLGETLEFSNGFVVETPTLGSETLMVLSNVQFQDVVPPFPIVFAKSDGIGSIISLTNVLTSINGSSNSTGVLVSNGGQAEVYSSLFDGLSIGLHIIAGGAAPFLRAVGTTINNSAVADILVDHPGATGTFNGVATQSKTTINPNSTFNVLYNDISNGNIVASGLLMLGNKAAEVVDVSTLIIEGSPMGLMEGGELGDGGGLNVTISAGFGYLEVEPEILKKYSWPGVTFAVPANQASYIYVDNTGALMTSMQLQDSFYNINLGRVVTSGSGIIFIDQSGYQAEHAANRGDNRDRSAFGSIYASGSFVSESGTRNLDVTSGIYWFSDTEFQPSGGTAISWTAYNRNGSGGYTMFSQNVVDNARYDDGSGTLASLTTNYYAKHSLYLVGDGPREKYLLVYSQQEYSALTLAEQGPIPVPPPYFIDGVVLIASLIVKQGTSSIPEIRDERPVLGFKATGVAATTFHSGLLGLATGDDHPQYFRNDGTHPMTGNLNMGGNNVTNVGTVDGVTVSAHASRHSPTGADPIATGPASTLTPDLTNATGTAGTLARADHIHNIPSAIALGLNTVTVNAQGSAASFSRSDHTHAIASSIAVTQNADQSNAAGSSTGFAKADHVHNIPTAVVVTIGTANAQGSALTFAKSDHVHSHGAQTSPTHHAVATTIANGFMSSTDKSKLDGIQAGATANSTDAFLLDRANHTGTQVAATISDFSTVARGLFSAVAPLSYNSATGAFTIPKATALVDGYLAATDWVIFNAKEPAISSGTTAQYWRGDKTFQTLNTGAVPESTNLYYTQARFDSAFAAKSTTDLAEGTNLYFTSTRARTSVSATAPISYNSATGAFSIPKATALIDGYLASTDWVIFNAKEPAISSGTTSQYWRGDKTFQTLNTGAVTESTNLYYTQGRFDSAFATKSTTELAEGTNLYYTQTRFNTAFAAKSTTDLAEGTNLYFTNARARSAISATAPIVYNSTTGALSLSTAAPITSLSAVTTNAAGSASTAALSDHSHAILTGVVSSQTADQANAAGTSANLARADHVHNIATAVPTDIGSANAQGSASTFVKSDHVHKGVHSVKAGSGGTQRFGDLSLLSGNGTSVADDGSGNFTIDTQFGPNEFVVTSTSGLQINYAGGRFANGLNGTIATVPSGSITVAANVTLGYLYVSVNTLSSGTPTVVASTTPPSADSLPIATYVSGPSSITSTTDMRCFVNVVTLTNQLRVTYSGSGLSVNYNTGGVRINGTLTTIIAGTIALSASSTGAIYVDPSTILVTANTTGIFPPGCVPLATYTTSGIAVTALTGVRSFINTNLVFGSAGDLSTILPNASAVAGSTNKYADAGHTHAIATAAASSISTSTTNTQGTATSFARSDHTHAVSITNNRVASTTLISTTSTTYVVMTGQTLTPAAGTYFVTARSQMSAISNNRNISMSLFKAGTQIADSEVSTFIRTGNATFTSADVNSLYTEAFITVDGTQAIDMRWLVSASTAQAQGYSLSIIKVA